MEHFIVSARKYRPQNFEEVVGQQAITNTLDNAIKNNHLAQALLFTGPRGVGKTSCARILAKCINQQSMTYQSQDFSFNIFELDAASNNSVDDIRSLIDQVRILPQTGKYKVYIIDEVHMLSSQAFNAFLKMLEEPPAHAIFILATTEKHKIIPTILSRCQIFDFKRIQVLDIKKYLKEICKKENITADDDALHIIAQKADGAMRDALSIFDRIISFSGVHLTRKAVTQNLNVLDYEVYFNMTDLLLKNDIPKVLIHFNTIVAKGFEGYHFVNGLASHFRDLLVSKDKSTIGLLEVGDIVKKKYLEQSTKTNTQFLLQAIDKINACDLNYRISNNQRLLVELTLMQIASITFNGEKKKSTNYIIPATFFTASVSDQNKQAETILKKNNQQNTNTDIKSDTILVEKQNLQNVKRRISGLSLKSIHQKKEEKKLIVKNDNDNQHLCDPFTKNEFLNAWKKYQQKLIELGKKNSAYTMSINEPKILNNFNIELAVPNHIMKHQLQTDKPALMFFLRKTLNNYSIELQIKVNETIEKKLVYTPKEKYEKLKEKNPLLEKLRIKFHLDL